MRYDDRIIDQTLSHCRAYGTFNVQQILANLFYIGGHFDVLLCGHYTIKELKYRHGGRRKSRGNITVMRHDNSKYSAATSASLQPYTVRLFDWFPCSTTVLTRSSMLLLRCPRPWNFEMAEPLITSLGPPYGTRGTSRSISIKFSTICSTISTLLSLQSS